MDISMNQVRSNKDTSEILLVIEIPGIPLKEGEKAIEYIKKNYSVNDSYLWEDGFAIAFSNEKKVVKGPRMCNEQAVDGFKSKISYMADYVMFYDSNGYIYCDTYVRLDPILVLREIPWIRYMKISGDLCTRPVKSISVFPFSPEYMNDCYCGVIVEEKFRTTENFLSFYKSKEILILQTDRRKKVSSIDVPSFCKDALDKMLHHSSNPNVVFLPLDSKYFSLPSRIIAHILSIELMIFPKYNYNVLEGFFYITGSNSYNLDGLLLSMNSRLEDLLVSYQRDRDNVVFLDQNKVNNAINYEEKRVLKVENEGLRGALEEKEGTKKYGRATIEFYNFTMKLVEEMGIKNVKKSFLNFLLYNFKNDYNTTLVEEYPELLGVLSYYLYEEYPDYNRNIQEGLLGYTGEIKNEYGLVLYISDKFYLLQELERRNQLATSSKDPFGSKGIVDKIIELVIKYELVLPKMEEKLVELFNKRFKIYLQNRYGDYLNKLKNKEEITLENMWKVNFALLFIEEYYERLSNIVNRISYTENVKFAGGFDASFDLYRNKHSLVVQLQFIESILKTNSNIFSNPQYIYIFQGFYRYISSIIEFN